MRLDTIPIDQLVEGTIEGATMLMRKLLKRDNEIRCEYELTEKHKKYCVIQTGPSGKIINLCEEERNYSVSTRMRLPNNPRLYASDRFGSYCNVLDNVAWTSYPHQKQRSELPRDAVMQILRELK